MQLFSCSLFSCASSIFLLFSACFISYRDGTPATPATPAKHAKTPSTTIPTPALAHTPTKKSFRMKSFRGDLTVEIPPDTEDGLHTKPGLGYDDISKSATWLPDQGVKEVMVPPK